MSGPARSRFAPQRETNPMREQKIKKAIFEYVCQSGDFRRLREDNLPGPLAATLSRAKMDVVRAEPYFVCEKSDGERRMLLALPEERLAVLVDRAFAMERLENGEDLCAAWCGRNRLPTLVDGELIVKPDGSAVYMLFDVVSHDGEVVGKLHFPKRLERIEYLQAKFKSLYEAKPLPSVRAPSCRPAVALPWRCASALRLPVLLSIAQRRECVTHVQLLVLSKEYADKSRVGEILSRISEEDDGTGHMKRKYKGRPPRENCTLVPLVSGVAVS